MILSNNAGWSRAGVPHLRVRDVLRAALIVASTLLLTACGGSEHLTFLNPQGPVAAAEMVHFYWVLGIMAVFVAGPIFLALPFFLWRYRYNNTKARYSPKWRDNTLITFLTWAGPVAIVIVLGFFVWRDSHKLDPYKPIASTQPALPLQVIGYDWKWLIIYPEQHIATIGTMVMPVGRPLSIHLTSATVMKSFFIPALGSQIYAMGGMASQLNLEASKRGRFLGEDTMYDGNGFHDEKFTAVAVSPAAFKAWVRHVQATGVPLDHAILKAISTRTTREQMVKSLPPAAVQNGSVYLTGVTAELFPRVVKALKEDTSPVVSIPVARAAEPKATTATVGSAKGVPETAMQGEP
ncbi:MAG: cytochrome ubiquinol oxidase subunit II [Gammaproteobacteria bacterium]